MAHAEQFQFVSGVREFLSDYFQSKIILEVGSLDINGSVRDFFTTCQYVGLDIGEGKSVDIVCPGQDYGERAASFDVIISCESMEHNAHWRETWLNMIRLMRPDGLMIMTCASPGRRQHGTSEFSPDVSPLTAGAGQDYYRNLVARDFEAILAHSAWFARHQFLTDHSHNDLLFWGVGLAVAAPVLERADALRAALDAFYEQRNTFGRY